MEILFDADVLNEFETLHDEAIKLTAAGNVGAAIPMIQLGLSILENTFGPEPLQVAYALKNAADHYDNQHADHRANLLYQHAILLVEKATGPDSPEMFSWLTHLARRYRSRGDHRAAEPLLARAIQCMARGADPEDPIGSGFGWAIEEGQLLHAEAAKLRDRDHYDAAIFLAKSARTLLENGFGGPSDLSSTSSYILGTTYARKKDYPNAELELRRAIVSGEKLLSPHHLTLATPLQDLARLYAAKEDYAQAEAHYARAIDILKKTCGPNDPRVGMALDRFAEMYFLKND
ncbi:tetratricopeptide repeat protein [Polyangium jinanense]|uniref:Tetratricopeptide repeat protein n=1 Tax=Polyangium jinanense TaxID=2829994 RepID=A0A9X3X5J7_9BACT|nr:tetratricopeptide repeat protein [Polyangium jinanense]